MFLAVNNAPNYSGIGSVLAPGTVMEDGKGKSVVDCTVCSGLYEFVHCEIRLWTVLSYEKYTEYASNRSFVLDCSAWIKI